MKKEVALITIHGMGKVKPNYFAELEDGLKKTMGNDWLKVSFQNIQYAPILQDAQNELWRDMVSLPSNDLDATKLRKFFLFGFGDAGSLEYSAHNDKKKYIAVQKAIQSKLLDAYNDLEHKKNKPVVIIAQSLGCQVISNYLWDDNISKGDANSLDLFIQRSTLTLDHIERKGPKYMLYLSSYEKEAKHMLVNKLKTEKDPTKLALFRSFLNRLELYKSLDNTLDSTGITQRISCDNYSGVLKSYCNKDSSYIFITTEINGGDSKHHETLDLFLRTIDFSKYNSNNDIMKELPLIDVPKNQINSFLKNYNLNKTNSSSYKKFNSLKNVISMNPEFYIKNSLKDVNNYKKNEILKGIRNINIQE